jgi:PLP dependent protein
VSRELSIISKNLSSVRDRIDRAAQRSGCSGQDIRLIAVTKYVSTDVARLVAEAGCSDLGESRPQELWRKNETLADLPIRWHLIGHLQRNKVRRTLPLMSLLHSADSLRLLRETDEECTRAGQRLSVLLEVNISGDETKHGFTPDAIANALPQIAQLANIEVRGLMAMAGLEGDLDDARREFHAVRELRDRLTTLCDGRLFMNELSMGMSGDFEVAIEEGATMVRVGSAIFEGLS